MNTAYQNYACLNLEVGISIVKKIFFWGVLGASNGSTCMVRKLGLLAGVYTFLSGVQRGRPPTTYQPVVNRTLNR
jgi:hypothetical protein